MSMFKFNSTVLNNNVLPKRNKKHKYMSELLQIKFVWFPASSHRISPFIHRHNVRLRDINIGLLWNHIRLWLRNRFVNITVECFHHPEELELSPEHVDSQFQQVQQVYPHVMGCSPKTNESDLHVFAN